MENTTVNLKNNNKCYHCKYQYFCHAYITASKLVDDCRIFNNPTNILDVIGSECKKFEKEE